jgi:hypothetical protein
VTDNLPVPAQPPDQSLMSFGQTRLDPGDIIMPRVKILQAQSAEVADASLGVNPGEFFNVLTSTSYGDKLRFVPILPFKQRLFLYRSERLPVVNQALVAAGLAKFDKGEQDGLKCRSYDMEQGQGNPGIACHECPLSQWIDNEPPLCTETYNVAASSEEGELIVLSFAKSSARQGKQMFSMIRMRPGAQATIFEAVTASEQGKKGTYYAPRIRPVERAPEELIREVRRWATQLQGVTLDVSADAASDESVDDGVGATNPF